MKGLSTFSIGGLLACLILGQLPLALFAAQVPADFLVPWIAKCNLQTEAAVSAPSCKDCDSRATLEWIAKQAKQCSAAAEEEVERHIPDLKKMTEPERKKYFSSIDKSAQDFLRYVHEAHGHRIEAASAAEAKPKESQLIRQKLKQTEREIHKLLQKSPWLAHLEADQSLKPHSVEWRMALLAALEAYRNQLSSFVAEAGQLAIESYIGKKSITDLDQLAPNAMACVLEQPSDKSAERCRVNQALKKNEGKDLAMLVVEAGLLSGIPLPSKFGLPGRLRSLFSGDVAAASAARKLGLIKSVGSLPTRTWLPSSFDEVLTAISKTKDRRVLEVFPIKTEDGSQAYFSILNGKLAAEAGDERILNLIRGFNQHTAKVYGEKLKWIELDGKELDSIEKIRALAASQGQEAKSAKDFLQLVSESDYLFVSKANPLDGTEVLGGIRLTKSSPQNPLKMYSKEGVDNVQVIRELEPLPPGKVELEMARLTTPEVGIDTNQLMDAVAAFVKSDPSIHRVVYHTELDRDVLYRLYLSKMKLRSEVEIPVSVHRIQVREVTRTSSAQSSEHYQKVVDKLAKKLGHAPIKIEENQIPEVIGSMPAGPIREHAAALAGKSLRQRPTINEAEASAIKEAGGF